MIKYTEDTPLRINIKHSPESKRLHKKIVSNYYNEVKKEISLFIITALVTLFPFLFIVICSIFEGTGLSDIYLTLISFFKRSDMLLAIISITASSVLFNAFSGNYKLYGSTIICWLIVISCGMYFCAYNSEKISPYRVLGVFIISLIFSIWNILRQVNNKINKEVGKIGTC